MCILKAIFTFDPEKFQKSTKGWLCKGFLEKEKKKSQLIQFEKDLRFLFYFF